jgi:hypothetical protein
MPGTFSTPGTFYLINVSGLVDQRNLKIPRFTLNAFYFTARNQIYVHMPADLDQFGRDHSHGTVIGGEGLVQPGHHPANGR